MGGCFDVEHFHFRICDDTGNIGGNSVNSINSSMASATISSSNGEQTYCSLHKAGDDCILDLNTKGFCNDTGDCVLCLDDNVKCYGSICPRCLGAKCNNSDGSANTDECASGYCFNHVCCNSFCGGEQCYSCNIDKHIGICSLVPFNLTNEVLCMGNLACNGLGNCQNAIGQNCISDINCIGNVCKGHCTIDTAKSCKLSTDCIKVGDICDNKKTCFVPFGFDCNSNSDCDSGNCDKNIKKCH